MCVLVTRMVGASKSLLMPCSSSELVSSLFLAYFLVKVSKGQTFMERDVAHLQLIVPVTNGAAERVMLRAEK